MGDLVAFPDDGYRYLKGVFQYSAAVAAEPGYETERARFLRTIPLEEGFRAVETHLAAIGRPDVALRPPAGGRTGLRDGRARRGAGDRGGAPAPRLKCGRGRGHRRAALPRRRPGIPAPPCPGGRAPGWAMGPRRRSPPGYRDHHCLTLAGQ